MNHECLFYRQRDRRGRNSHCGVLSMIGNIIKKAIENFFFVIRTQSLWGDLWSGLAVIGWTILASQYEGEPLYNTVFFDLTTIADPYFWIVTGLILGAIQLACFLSLNMKFRWCSAFLASWWWSILALSIYDNDPINPSGALYVIFAIANLASMFRFARAIK